MSGSRAVRTKPKRIAQQPTASGSAAFCFPSGLLFCHYDVKYDLKIDVLMFSLRNLVQRVFMACEMPRSSPFPWT
jgi:hypothetical protein